MKFQVQMKDPDTLYDAINDAVTHELKRDGFTDAKELEILIEHRSARVSELCRRWFKYGEYLIVEIDTPRRYLPSSPGG